MKNKSTLAKLLAEEDVFVIHKQMETAYFDSKKRELGLPIWKDEEMTEDIYDLMVCHEIGHALWTPLDMLETAANRKINHSFVNIIEDARIEKFVKNKYPGALSVFNRGYNDLIKKDFFGTNGKDVNSFNLIDRINISFKGNSTITFSDEEKVWVDRVAKTKTPDDVLDLAEELYAWMEENESETDNHNSGEEKAMPDSSGEKDKSGESSESGESGESSESGESGEAGEDGSDETSDGKSSSVGDESDDKSDAEGNSNSDGGSNTVGGKKATDTGGPPEATTDSAFGKAMDELRDKVAEDRFYAKIPKVDLDEIIISPKTLLEEFVPYFLDEKEKMGSEYWDNTFEKLASLKNDSKKTVSYMVKEFEMKKAADAYSRAAVSKTGSLDMSKLHTYKYNEDLFKKITTLPGATNHGMVMVLDWSGSMHENLLGTLAQMYNLIWFCRRIKIPFEVYAFSDRYDRKDGYGRGAASAEDKQFKAGDVALKNFKLLNFFSSNMTTSEEMSMMHILWMHAARHYSYTMNMGYAYSPPRNLFLGGTPLDDTIVAMMELVPKFKKETGVQKVNTIFLTDGASNGVSGVYDYEFNKEENTHTEVITRLRDYHKSKIILTDPVMNKTYEIKNMTNDLLRILKNRVPEMNVVGFFIAGTGRGGKVNKNTLYYLLPNDSREMIMEKIKFLNKNNYLALDQLGYDEYYILPGGNSLKVENETLDDELIGASKAKLKTAFGKMSKGKVSSRQLLNKFVKMVA